MLATPRTTLALLTLAAFSVRLVSFMQTPHPLGTDGYYYVVQGAHWASEGLHVPDSSWMLRLLGMVAMLFKPILATKLVAAGLAAAVVPAAFLLGRALKHPTAPWLLAGWTACSPTLTQLAIDFPKNLAIAAPWLLLCAALLQRRWWSAVAWAALLATAHRLGAVLLLFTLGGLLLSTLSKRVFAALILAGAVLSVLSALPGTLNLAEGFRIAGQIEPGSGWPPFCWFSLRQMHPLQQVELVAAAATTVFALTRLKQPITPLAWPLLGLAVAPIWRADTLDLGYRLALITPLLAAPILASSLPSRPWSPAWLFLLLPCSLFGDPHDAPPYDHYTILIDDLPHPLPKLLIAHQGINFLYDHRTGHEAMAWAPDPQMDPHPIGRIVWGVRESEWAAYQVPRVRLDRAYSYVKETDWHLLLNRAEAEADDDLAGRLLDWRNPRRIRPSALTRGRATLPPPEDP